MLKIILASLINVTILFQPIQQIDPEQDCENIQINLGDGFVEVDSQIDASENVGFYIELKSWVSGTKHEGTIYVDSDEDWDFRFIGKKIEKLPEILIAGDNTTKIRIFENNNEPWSGQVCYFQ